LFLHSHQHCESEQEEGAGEEGDVAVMSEEVGDGVKTKRGEEDGDGDQRKVVEGVPQEVQDQEQQKQKRSTWVGCESVLGAVMRSPCSDVECETVGETAAKKRGDELNTSTGEGSQASLDASLVRWATAERSRGRESKTSEGDEAHLSSFSRSKHGIGWFRQEAHPRRDILETI
jgi:hypothetical protein